MSDDMHAVLIDYLFWKHTVTDAMNLSYMIVCCIIDALYDNILHDRCFFFCMIAYRYCNR